MRVQVVPVRLVDSGTLMMHLVGWDMLLSTLAVRLVRAVERPVRMLVRKQGVVVRTVSMAVQQARPAR